MTNVTAQILKRKPVVQKPAAQKAATKEYTSKDGDAGYMLSYTDIPTSILKAIKDGKKVWQLIGYKEDDDDKTLYIILAKGGLENIVQVEHQSKISALLFHGKENAPNRDVYGWRLLKPIYNNDDSKAPVRIEWNWTLTKNSNKWKLTKNQMVKVKPCIITTKITIDITIDKEVGEGFWRMSQTKHTKYRGSAARFPDETKTKRSEGAFLPVPR